MPADGAAGTSATGPQLPEHMETQRTQVICGPDLNYHVRTVGRLESSLLAETNTEYLVADFYVHISKHVYGVGYQQCMGLPEVGGQLPGESAAKGRP